MTSWTLISTKTDLFHERGELVVGLRVARVARRAGLARVAGVALVGVQRHGLVELGQLALRLGARGRRRRRVRLVLGGRQRALQLAALRLGARGPAPARRAAALRSE